MLQLQMGRLWPEWKWRTTGSAGPPLLSQHLQIPLPGSAEGSSLRLPPYLTIPFARNVSYLASLRGSKGTILPACLKLAYAVLVFQTRYNIKYFHMSRLHVAHPEQHRHDVLPYRV